MTFCGWAHRRRDHGGVIFIDLRDRRGITQVVFNPELNAAVHEKAHVLRSEWVIAIRGKVTPRPEGMVNPKLKTGEIEILVDELRILNKSKTPPFPLDEGRSILTCSAEDLVVLKAFAGRDQDWLDIEGVITRQGPALGKALILRELEPLLELKGDMRALERLQAMLKRLGS